MLFINADAKGRRYSGDEHYVAMDQMKGSDVGTSYLNRKKPMEFSIAITHCGLQRLRNIFQHCTG